ncbi:MAG: hypothetical protein IIC60_06965 [Proteobacteria bacterium]|nr:hypothetical protein [Pseudomonadota bacterium]
MSDDKQVDSDPERTLITLEQLSQTIEVMTSVVNRLRQHLSEQLKAQIEPPPRATQDQPANESEPTNRVETDTGQPQQATQKRESFVVEINQQGFHGVRKNTKILH